jgi:hypothetical protein
MENEKTKINEEKRDYLSAIFLLQGLFVGVLLIAVYIIKIFVVVWAYVCYVLSSADFP